MSDPNQMRRRIGIALGVGALVMVLGGGVAWYRSTGDDGPGPSPTPLHSGPVHEAMHGLLDGYANDFDAAAAEVGVSVSTDQQLLDFLVKRTTATRTKAMAPIDAWIEKDLPRDVDKLRPEAKAFLKSIADEFRAEATKHE